MMAKAPRPVQGGRAAQKAATDLSKQVAVITVADVEYRIGLRNVPLGERIYAEGQTGRRWEDTIGLLAPVGAASVAVWVWMARRLAGEVSLSWPAFVAEWDDTLQLGDGIDVEFETPTGGDDPEA